MRTPNWLRCIAVVVGLVLMLQFVWADPIVVNNGNDDGPGSLRNAIAQATDGSIITFSYYGSVSLLTSLVLNKNLTIVGPGSDLLTITRAEAAAGNFSLIQVNSGETVQMTSLTVANGVTAEAGGGGIRNQGILVLAAVRIEGNRAFGGGFPIQTLADGGGCLNLSGATLLLTNCYLTNNSCNGDGGGIRNEGSLNLFGSTVAGNSAINGGGVNSTAVTTITNCTFSHNVATTGGPDGLQGGFGGGMALDGGATLVSDTVTANTCVFEGGGIAGGSNVTLKNCLVAGNLAPSNPDKADLTFTIASQGYNLIGIAPDGQSFLTSDQRGTVDQPLAAMLGPLQLNGGTYPTMALLPGSPAIDQGISAGLIYDERGLPRTVDQPNIPNAPGGDGTDIGAFELGFVVPTFGNISTRLSVGTGDHVLIGGFIIGGTSPKRILVRGLGPSLPLTGTLSDPVLQLADSSSNILTTNDNWQDSSDKQAIIDTGVPPPNPAEAALIATLDPGTYTTILSGKNNGTGQGLVEIYDLDQPGESSLVNISTRGFVQQGDNVMIGGLIILGTEPVDVLLRAIGRSLPVLDALADPTLELHDSDGTLLTANDNWKDTQESEIEAIMIAPPEDAESAILATLLPGAYTAIVRGANDSTGVALVEAYRLGD